jgi:hypothetical protein
MALTLKMAAKNRCFSQNSPKILFAFSLLIFVRHLVSHIYGSIFFDRFKMEIPIQNGRQILMRYNFCSSEDFFVLTFAFGLRFK